jgi:hypothetical protein
MVQLIEAENGCIFEVGTTSTNACQGFSLWAVPGSNQRPPACKARSVASRHVTTRPDRAWLTRIPV